MERRSFLSVLAAALAGTVTRPVQAAPRKVAIDLSRLDRLGATGGWAVLDVKGKTLLLLRTSPDEVRVLSAVCTHQRCIVSYSPEEKAIACPCHGSRYDLDGSPTRGPAAQPLTRHPAGQEGTRLVITLEDE